MKTIEKIGRREARKVKPHFSAAKRNRHNAKIALRHYVEEEES